MKNGLFRNAMILAILFLFISVGTSFAYTETNNRGYNDNFYQLAYNICYKVFELYEEHYINLYNGFGEEAKEFWCHEVEYCFYGINGKLQRKDLTDCFEADFAFEDSGTSDEYYDVKVIESSF